MTGQEPDRHIHAAAVSDAATVAALLDAFNREFDTPTPGIEMLTDVYAAPWPAATWWPC